MSDRPGRRTPPRAPRPSPVDEARTRPAGIAAPGELPVDELAGGTGPMPVPGVTRSGDDVRRRGWFWHWNSIVTQYAPLIGLKGVGLLNSYTVWTDRREESPHRGYAFPSQQSEADFYGEDRAELITINKILVALDLIEIRKEMVLRVDEQGRRWKVPHNFYRVKDHGDGVGLTRDDVLRVASLADRDPAVYRYVRRVFSPRFSPIGRENVWVRILAEVREHEVWQRLSERAASEERRASARTRAGHAARKGLATPVEVDSATRVAALNDSTAGESNTGSSTTVAGINSGLAPDVGGTNPGLHPDSTTTVGPANAGPASGVELANRTYDQSRITTTTTESERASKEETGLEAVLDRPGGASQRPVTAVSDVVTGRPGSGPGGLPAPEDGPAANAASRAFEDANARASSPAERRILGELAERFDGLARGSGYSSGWALVAAAIDEAVEAGSAYVAPRRIREILTRWERDGAPRPADVAASERWSARPVEPAALLLSGLPDLPMPGGLTSSRAWAAAVARLATALEPGALAELVEGTGIIGYRGDEVLLLSTDPRQAERLMGEYRELVARKLGEALRRPVRIAVQTAARPPAQTRASASDAAPLPDAPVAAASFLVEECGLPSAQVWAAVLDELVASGGVSRADAAAWFASTRLLGRGDDGSLIVGAAHPLAQRRIATRFAAPLRAAIAAVLGVERSVEVVTGQLPRDQDAGAVTDVA